MNELSTQAEVSDLDDHVLEKDVVELQVAVDHELAVHVLHAIQDLIQIVARLDLCQTLSPPYQTSQGLARQR